MFRSPRGLASIILKPKAKELKNIEQKYAKEEVISFLGGQTEIA